MNFYENINIAFNSVRSNFLRSLLTMLIITVGITCLVGILTAIDTILYTMDDNFNRLGANSFKILPNNDGMRSRHGGKSAKLEVISYEQAIKFKDKFNFGGATISLDLYGTRSAVIGFKNKKTNPTVRVVGIDENYLLVSSYEIESGRNFNKKEIEQGVPKVILGSDIVKQLFDSKDENALGKIISIGNLKYKVIGTLKPQGASSGGSNDRRVFISLFKAKQIYGSSTSNYAITGAVKNTFEVENAINAAIGKMRVVKNLRPHQDNNFTIRKSDSILETLKNITTELRWATIAIALITLLGAAIGLMNIMLVSVTERTREIGVRKAIGATSNNILIQFLTEAILICQLGGLLGIIFGIVLGYGVAAMIKGRFVIPWEWMALGIIVCIFVGVISGLYPALKAAKLDPIESLRYE